MPLIHLLCVALLAMVHPLMALTPGMTVQEVRQEMGKPTSELARGAREVLIYGTQKLEFQNGLLIKENDKLLLPTAPAAEPAPGSLIDLDPSILNRQTQRDTIATDGLYEPAPTPSGEFMEYGQVMEDFGNALEQMDAAQADMLAAPSKEERLIAVLAGFIIDLIVTCIVLRIAFQIVGFPCLFHQLAIISILVALAGLMTGLMLGPELSRSVGGGIGFILLLLLIPKMTDVREWATTIKIAITARLVSIGLGWAIFAGAMMLLGMGS